MIKVELPLNDNLEMLVLAIGYERRELMDMELEEFISYRSKGYFTRTKYRLCASADMNAYIEVSTSDNEHLVLVLQPRVESVTSVLKEVIDAFTASKDSKGDADPRLFCSLISDRAAEGVIAHLSQNL